METPDGGPIHVLAAVIERDGKVLLCRRPQHKRHGGLWEFPGGKLHAGETHAEAAQRELEEELAIQAVSVGAVRFSRQDPGSVFIIDFVDVLAEGDPAPTEHAAVEWVTKQNLLKYPMPPTDRAFAEHVCSGR